jgi:organic radical activating enzyme
MEEVQKSRNQIIMDENYRLRNEVINKVSPSFCTAKWLQSTIYLWNGFTHSCHHPSAHKVFPEAVELNPKALHNTPIKLVAREDMLKGIQTKECTYCWNIENGPGDHLSDRTYKSISPWAMESMDKVIESGLGNDINPTYLEVAFENTCNFKCTYCTSDVSSKWMEEIERHGPYQLSEGNSHDLGWMKMRGQIPIKRDDYNPYVEAFWKWWPELIQTLKVFRITGGEPLLSKHTFRVFDYIIDNPKLDLDLCVNTNMNVPRKLIDKLIDYSNRLKGKVKSFEVYTSLEATGPQAEYIRYGMVYDEFVDNCRYFLSSTETRLHFMVATNLLSVTTFDEFLKLVYTLRTEFNENDADNRIPMMISYVRWPQHLNIRNLPKDIKAKYGPIWRETVMTRTRQTSPNKAGRFYLEEIDQIERLIDFMDGVEDIQMKNMKDFFLYHEQYDERRNTNFFETFPELIPFYEDCRNAVDGIGQ